MRIKMLKYYSGARNAYQYFHTGNEYEIDAQRGKSLVDDGYAEEVKPEPKSRRAAKKGQQVNEGDE